MPELEQLDGFSVRKFPDAVFIGQIDNGKRHGKGLMRYKNGRQYEGEWENDLRQGRGFEKYPNGNSYYG